VPSLGKKSKERRDTCDQELQDVLNEAIKHFDFSIIWGHRGMFDQHEAFRTGQSRNRWPTSRHNKFPSKAFDIVPYPEGYDAEYTRFFEMASYILGAASRLGVPLIWGGHWKNYTGNGENDRDWSHFELIS